MRRSELIKLIRAARIVKVYANIFKDDAGDACEGVYVRVHKIELIERLNNVSPMTRYDAEYQADIKTLYID